MTLNEFNKKHKIKYIYYHVGISSAAWIYFENEKDEYYRIRVKYQKKSSYFEQQKFIKKYVEENGEKNIVELKPSGLRAERKSAKKFYNCRDGQEITPKIMRKYPKIIEVLKLTRD